MTLYYLTGSPHFDCWWWFVGVGMGALFTGTLVWDVACLRLLLLGYRWRALVLAGAGTAIGGGQVLGALLLDLVLADRMGQTVAVVFGVRVRRPDLLLLPDSALSWVIAGAALAVMGVAILAIRPSVRDEHESADGSG